MLRKVNGTAPEDYAKAIAAQTHAPDFDLVANLKARRLRWLWHVLRMPEASLLRRVVLRHGTTDLPDGTIFDDAPEHASLEELVELAGNHVTKLGKRRCAEWGMAVAKLQRGGGAGMAGLKANTPEETEAALEELGPDCVRIYTDGGGVGEHGDTAGWGAHAVRGSTARQDSSLSLLECLPTRTRLSVSLFSERGPPHVHEDERV